MTVHLNGDRIKSPVSAQLSDREDIIFVTLANYVVLGICRLPVLQVTGNPSSLIGISQEINLCRSLINRFAATDLPVMLMGETGTGKELAATDLHANSTRAGGPLVTVNMAAIPQELAVTELFGSKKGAFTGSARDRQGSFQQAEGGTLFCDEIGDTPALVQPMLLRALESKAIQVLGHDSETPVDVRFIAATDRPVDVEAEGFRFSKPLYHRLAAAQIKMPPLRNRKVDIPLLILHFLDQNNISGQFSHMDIETSQISDLLKYSWPGNVRELKNAVNAILLGQTPNLLPEANQSSSIRSTSKDQYRAPSSVAHDELLAALHNSEWLIKPAAESLSISRTSCYELIKNCPAIRPVEHIPREELRQIMAQYPGDLAAWAAALQVPQEALRKHVRSAGLI
ncbi:MAG: sigma-54-dependent Fis family transcriptional regulator [Kordiimonadaceae bacterium]|nr:sigma-54-dependent Fis family transcriptional regulator [Kordiimonadaceae bacterium]MBO6567519.1 sigma-54-dependent Fis family transcriptional regulator [Kordiimonadaceae bacterium]MBO6963267.1 sigma-54-dependent Fis family transcriptional regulator [Kordiimonadaceae bacterium]